MKYIIYTTYMFENDSYNLNNVIANSTPIHCNYINKIEIDELQNTNINLFFNSIDDFKHMYQSGETYGWSANKFKILVQIVSDDGINLDLKPKSNNWRVYDVTDQITFNNVLTPVDMLSTVFNIELNNYNKKDIYNLDYLNYPSNQKPNDLGFGDEVYFFGNVETRIQAIGYRMNITLNLENNKYNYTTNPTWDGNQDILISEVGIYSEDGELVAIGKFNNPISKNNNISRNITFELDF